MTKIATVNGYEFWYAFDKTAGVYEIFLSDDGSHYIGCCDDEAQIRRFIAQWISEREGF